MTDIEPEKHKSSCPCVLCLYGGEQSINVSPWNYVLAVDFFLQNVPVLLQGFELRKANLTFFVDILIQITTSTNSDNLISLV